MLDKGLGRGLNSLLKGNSQGQTVSASTPSEDKLASVPTDKIIPNPRQPRKTIAHDSLEELAQSIKSDGIIQPLLVRKSNQPGYYELIAGERRWKAAKIAGLAEVPVFIRALSDREVMVAALVENIQREDLNPAEEARALQDLKDKLGLTQEELAVKVGKSRSVIANSLRLLQLPEKALDSLQRGRITAGHARCLLSVADAPETVLTLLEQVFERGLSVRDTEDAASFWKQNKRFPWDAEETVPQPHGEIKKQRRQKSEETQELEKRLSAHLHCRTKVSGSHEKGKISISYKNSDELLALLSLLGIQQQGEQS